MKTSMVTQDAQTFVALGRAMALARLEGTLDPSDAVDLSAALVAGILTGCMEFETYARIHEAMAEMLDLAFEGPPPPMPATPQGGTGSEEQEAESLGVYLEVVGEAWDKVTWDAAACGRLKAFVRKVFVLDGSRFGEDGWFRAPLTEAAQEVLRAAKAAGLLVVALEGALPAGPAIGTLADPDSPSRGSGRMVLGWGDRRTALDLVDRS